MQNDCELPSNNFAIIFSLPFLLHLLSTPFFNCCAYITQVRVRVHAQGQLLVQFFGETNVHFLSCHCHFLLSRPEATWRNILATGGERERGKKVLQNIPDNVYAVLSNGAQPAWLMANKPQSKRAKLPEAEAEAFNLH